jgi:hypothetical protein
MNLPVQSPNPVSGSPVSASGSNWYGCVVDFANYSSSKSLLSHDNSSMDGKVEVLLHVSSSIF